MYICAWLSEPTTTTTTTTQRQQQPPRARKTAKQTELFKAAAATIEISVLFHQARDGMQGVRHQALKPHSISVIPHTDTHSYCGIEVSYTIVFA